MDGLNRSKVAASQAPAVLAKYIEGKLKSGARPLILISDSHDRTAVAKKLENSIGASIVQTGSLLAAADYGDQKISLAALTYVNEDYQLAKTAAEMRLLVQIYGYLRKENRRKKFKNPLAVSIMFRDVLIEMENERGSEDIANSPDDDAYVEEFCFVRELWYAFIKPLRVDRRKRLENYAQELADSKSPVAYLHWGDEDKQIVEFLKSAQEKGAPVAIYEADFEVEKSKDKQLDCEDELETEEGKAKLLDRLWRGEGINAKLEFKSALAYQAQTLEEAAEAAKRMLYSWLPPEPPDKALKIGILAYDRQLVRRLSSMLLQDDIHLQDTTGWPANNLLIGKALLALASTSGMEAKDLLRNTQNIAVRERLQSGWWQTPRYLASSSAKQEKWAKKWEDMKKLEKDLDDFICKSKGKRKISAWFDGLADQAEGEIYGSFFNQDDAAHSLRKLLRMLADEFKDVEEKEDDSDGDYRIDEVKRLLFDSLAATNLVPSNNESPIQLIRPGRFTTRKFDAVLLAGADSTQLPLATAPQLFNDKVRAMLGLPDIAKKIQKQRRALAWMLENTKQVGTVWHGEAGVSPYIELMLEHTKKVKETGKNDVKLEKLKRPWDKAVGNDALTGHKARLYHGIENTSVSSCVKLMECPYQYYASKVLRLREDRPQNIGERRERYGSFVHEIL
ncbi:MAG: PD-(D/E)XK nuclease family protein, partial [Betaproteobacteria bacterium AqS2]|nr:PD-(D/E)XK nuclease family protein [Betaproteobacteria bacterium AqS2]